MGGICGKLTEAELVSKDIDETLNNEKKKVANVIRLLLLGAGDCGKSTIAKQMKVIHMNGFGPDELDTYRTIICGNVINSMRSLITAANSKNVLPLDENDEIFKKYLLDPHFHSFHDSSLPEGTIEDIQALWNDPGIRDFYNKTSDEFQLDDSTEYWFRNVERMGAKDYVPSIDDILRSRRRTTGINEIIFSIANTEFVMVDVGGQRSERRKWIHCFEGVTAVLFVAALSEYARNLYEDNKTNRMKESLDLFDDICNLTWFKNSHIILFLNKRDLFEEKIKKIPLSVCFQTYNGPNEYDICVDYIKKRFLELNKNTKKSTYVHVTCATDTNNIQFVFSSIKDILIRNAMSDYGIM